MRSPVVAHHFAEHAAPAELALELAGENDLARVPDQAHARKRQADHERQVRRQAAGLRLADRLLCDAQEGAELAVGHARPA
jgi:hypothetical protein